VHEHSITTHRVKSQDGTFGRRTTAVLGIIKAAGRPLTDWEVLQKFKPGSDNLNLVRPRITELHKMGELREGPPGRSNCKSVPVRTSEPSISQGPQQSLF